jgi:hypothetical protein
MIQDALAIFCKGKHYSCGETYESLNWLDDSPKPTKSQVNEWIAQMPAILENKIRIAELKQLLAGSDFRMTTDYFASMSEQDQTHWIGLRHDWREELRGLDE